VKVALELFHGRKSVDEQLETLLDDLVVLRYRATNYPPHLFEWVDATATANDYGAMLTRLARDYDGRFGARHGSR
jgi:hypothetical protein